MCYLQVFHKRSVLQSRDGRFYNPIQSPDTCTGSHTMVLPVTPEVNYTFSVSLATVPRVELLSRLGRSNRATGGGGDM